ncbi:hypothetical protein GCM10023330_05450 [Litoribaculum gwangyangense]|uniref:Uncharacterized protein n=1 Tax=Litoribaculum gwangyangense TaxID=1130722 RepID=A0ABP9BY79_9FLAO
MAMFRIRIKIEKALNKIISNKVVFTCETPINDSAKKMKETTKGSLLSNLETNHPEAIVPNKALTGITIKSEPN